MKKENKTLITIAAVAAGALLLTKSKGVNGVGGVFSSNKKLNTVLQSIFDDMAQSLGRREVLRYMREFPRETDYNIAQYGNLLIYYDDVRKMYLNAGYSNSTLGSNDHLWNIYLRQVGWVARNFVNMLPEEPGL